MSHLILTFSSKQNANIASRLTNIPVIYWKSMYLRKGGISMGGQEYKTDKKKIGMV